MEIPPIDAELALAEMRARREQVVDTNLVPNWFWPAVGALMVLYVAAVESEISWLVGGGTMAYVLGLVIVIAAVARRARLRVSLALLGSRGVLAILAFAGTLIVVGLALGFALEAMSVPFPATVGIVPVAVGLTVGGPRLMSYLRRLMLSRPLAGSR